MRLTRGRARQKVEIKKLDIPKVITEDLGYYMQFGFKRIPTTDNGRYHAIKHAKKPYAIFNAYE
tara:strand:+ start:1513 stop:1704 length:192 start_codon:yes stop_codon:yes gene_type:complete